MDAATNTQKMYGIYKRAIRFCQGRLQIWCHVTSHALWLKEMGESHNMSKKFGKTTFGSAPLKTIEAYYKNPSD